MDQSVAIQETLAEGEYCIIISFPALSSQPQGLPGLGKWKGKSMYLSALPPLPQHPGRGTAVFTQYFLSTGLSSRLPR